MQNETRMLIERAFRGEIGNPFPSAFKLASEFSNTATYFKQINGRKPKDYDEWRRYTEDFARNKKLKWTWIGDVPNLNQIKSNAFFLDNRLKNLPVDSIRVVQP